MSEQRVHTQEEQAPKYSDQAEPVLNKYLGATLKVGSIASVGLILSGLVWSGLTGQALPGTASVMSLKELLVAGKILTPTGVINAGVLALLLTPITGVLVALACFIVERDRKFSLVTLAVLSVVLIGVLWPF